MTMVKNSKAGSFKNCYNPMALRQNQLQSRTRKVTHHMKEYISVLIKGVGKSSFVCNYHKCLGYYHGEINIGKKCNVTSLPALGRPTLTQMPSWTCRSARSPFWFFRINIYDLINSVLLLCWKSLCIWWDIFCHVLGHWRFEDFPFVLRESFVGLRCEQLPAPLLI